MNNKKKLVIDLVLILASLITAILMTFMVLTKLLAGVEHAIHDLWTPSVAIVMILHLATRRFD